MSEHTPGPWTVNGVGGDFSVIARLEPSGVLISARGEAGDPIATARVMAASPVLLKALKTTLDFMEATYGNVHGHDWLDSDAAEVADEIQNAILLAEPAVRAK